MCVLEHRSERALAVLRERKNTTPGWIKKDRALGQSARLRSTYGLLGGYNPQGWRRSLR
jgi:hypothetical protein